ncbi:hypothetical protein F8S13_20200 [Chloroflexia bacterium SDU3-3]|nr:hypothetical protein F8S13_20200 [Chloroflexia bacterium SDU3-3]
MKRPLPRRAHAGRQLIIATALACFLPAAAHTATADSKLETSLIISNSGDQSESPAITYAGNTIGITWGEREDQKISTAIGSPDTPPARDSSTKTGSNTKTQTPDIAADAAGNLHLTYTTDNNIYYQYKPAGAGWQGAVRVGSDDYPNPSRIAVAPNGRIWIIWRETSGHRIGFRYSDTHGASWSSGSADGVVAKYPANMIGIDIAIGSDGIPHVVWYVIEANSQKGDIFVADWNGSSFQTSKITTNNNKLFDQDPTIAIDKDNVQHVVFRRRLSESPQQWAVFYASRRPDAGWENYTPLEIMNGDMQYSPSIGLDEAGSLYAGYSKPITGNERRIILLSKLPAQSVWVSQAISSGRRDYRPVIVGTAQGNLKAHIAYQQGIIGANDEDEIVYARYHFGPLPQAINADPVFGAGSTSAPSVSVSFANLAGNPTQVRWKWGAAPSDTSSDSGGWQPYTSPLSIALPSSAASCSTLALYAQVRNSDAIDTSVASASITYDGAVQASATLANPHGSAGLARYVQGAQGGDSAFTRESVINVQISDSGDCSALQSFSIGGRQESWPADAAAVARTALVDLTTLGQQQIPIQIRDSLQNTISQTMSFTYDPRSPNDSEGAGAPQYRSGSLSIDGSNNIIQHLQFHNVDVLDTIYQAATGKPFWGVWATVSPQLYSEDQINSQDSPLQWAAIAVPQPSASFDLDLSLATGQDGGDLTHYEGTYYVYIKFLDGAGNPSSKTLISEPVTLDTGYQIPKNFLPSISK